MLRWVVLVVVACGATLGCDDPVCRRCSDASAVDAPLIGPTVVNVQWTIATAAGEQQPCPAEFPVVEIEARALMSGTTSRETARCVDQQAMIMLPAVSLRDPCCAIDTAITNGAGATYAVHLFEHASNTGAPQILPIVFVTDRGYLHVHALCTQGGVSVACGVVTAEPLTVSVTDTSGATSTLPSSEIAGSGPLPSGPATVTVTLGTMVKTVGTVVPTGSQVADVDVHLDF